MKRPVVAIDGPAGAGKSTVTKLVAKKLGYVVVDTGALYRTIALAASRRGIDWDDDARVGDLSEELVTANTVRLENDATGDVRVLLAGEDVSLAIRTLEIGQGASKVSVQPRVRAALLDLQRAAGAAGGVVVEGRDIGTVVFPDAQAKFFLTATVDVRARRRYDELQGKGAPADLEHVAREVVERDRRDSTRPISPLKQAPDAISLDSSSLSVEEVVERIAEHVRSVEAALQRG